MRRKWDNGRWSFILNSTPWSFNERDKSCHFIKMTLWEKCPLLKWRWRRKWNKNEAFPVAIVPENSPFFQQTKINKCEWNLRFINKFCKNLFHVSHVTSLYFEFNFKQLVTPLYPRKEQFSAATRTTPDYNGLVLLRLRATVFYFSLLYILVTNFTTSRLGHCKCKTYEFKAPRGRGTLQILFFFSSLDTYVRHSQPRASVRW